MLIEQRKDQIVPTLSVAQIQFALRFASGPARRFTPNETLLDVGERDTIVWLVVEVSIIASRRDGLGREQFFASGGPGQFSGEVSDLSGQAPLGRPRDHRQPNLATDTKGDPFIKLFGAVLGLHMQERHAPLGNQHVL
jgi:CRP-like cAMP-binding protein